MRGVLAAAVLCAAMLTGAGCTDSGGSGTSGSTATPTATTTAGATATSTASVTAADRQVCTDTEKLIEDSTKKFGQEVLKAAQAGSGDSAVTAVKTLFTEWSAGMRTQAGKATNPDLTSALTEYASALEKVNSQITTVGDLTKLQQLNTPEIQAANEKISRICG